MKENIKSYLETMIMTINIANRCGSDDEVDGLLSDFNACLEMAESLINEPIFVNDGIVTIGY